MKRLEQAIHMLRELVGDETAPTDVRESCQECIHALEEEMKLPHKISYCLSILSEVSKNPSLTTYEKSQIWNIMSILEALSLGQI